MAVPGNGSNSGRIISVNSRLETCRYIRSLFDEYAATFDTALVCSQSALEATQWQIDGFFSQVPYKCHHLWEIVLRFALNLSLGWQKATWDTFEPELDSFLLSVQGNVTLTTDIREFY